MHRRTRTALITAATATALLLTGCGSDDSGDDEAAGAKDTTEQTDTVEEEEEPEPGSGPDDGIEHPEIDLGDHYEIIHEIDYTGDPVEDAILRSAQGFSDALGEAAAVGFDSDRPALHFYLADPALSLMLGLLEFDDEAESVAGTTRYFNYSATLGEEGEATVGLCEDTSQEYTIDVETGETIEEPELATNFFAISLGMEQSEAGTWQVVDAAADEQEPINCV